MDNPNNPTSLEHIEFETKYSVDDALLVKFKQMLDPVAKALPELPNGKKRFIYVEGPDFYYTYPESWFTQNPQWDPEGTFARYRVPSFGLDDGKRQVTWKYKPIDSKNNIQRKEMNWDIAPKTDDKAITHQLELQGLTFNFSIIKNCHIYFLDDATLVFYTVYDTTDGDPKKTDSFLEIEVDEDSMAGLTEPQAWAIIEKYEKFLAPMGINAQKRLKQSLFKRYVRRKK